MPGPEQPVVPSPHKLTVELARILLAKGLLTQKEFARLQGAEDSHLVGLRVLAGVMRDRLGVTPEEIDQAVKAAQKPDPVKVDRFNIGLFEAVESVELEGAHALLSKLDALSVNPVARAAWKPWITQLVSRVAREISVGGAIRERDLAMLTVAVETVTKFRR